MNRFSDEYWDWLYDKIVNNDRDAIMKELSELEEREKAHGQN